MKTTCLKKYLLLIVVLCLYNIGYTQSLSFADIDAGEVCQEAEVKVILVNNSGVDISDSQIEIRLHCGAEYVTGSAQGGDELNINDKARPIFTVAKIADGESLQVSLKFKNSCITKDCIDNGDDIMILAVWTVGSDNFSILSPSLNIRTANLLFTSLSNTYIELIETNRFERVIKIRNTRLGNVSEFNIVESYNRNGYTSIIEGVDKTDSIPGFNTYKIGEEIIRQFGDGDALFEFGEEITLVNKVIIDICPFDVKNIGCGFSLEWGCDPSKCQVERRKCAIKLKPPVLIDDILEYEVRGNLPQCFFNESAPQSVTIKNISAFTKATNLQLRISNGLLTGILDGSVDVVGVDSFNIEYAGEQNIACDGLSYGNAIVSIDEFNPGEELVLRWIGDFCDQAQCNFLSYFWNVRYSYLKDCAASIDAVKVGSIPFSWSQNLGSIILRSIRSGDNVLTDGAMITINNEYESNNFTNGDGFVDLAYTIPCGMEVASTDLTFGGAQPISTEIEDLGSESIFTIRYPKPLDATELNLNLDFSFNCDSTCNRNLCTTVFAGTCTSPCSSPGADVTIGTKITIFEDRGCAILPKIVDSVSHMYSIDCGIQGCVDSLPGWVEHTLIIERISKGLKDDNDDGVPDDNSIALDDSIALRRAMLGDTISIDINGVVHVDFNTDRLDRLFLKLDGSLTGITPRIELIKGPVEFFRLFNEDGFPLVEGEGEIIKAGSNVVYPLKGLKYSPDTTFGTFILDLSVDSLQTQGFVPQGFGFEEGDSISIRLKHRIDYNVASTNFIEIIPSVLSFDITSVFGFDENLGEDYVSGECFCSTDELEVTSIQFAGSKFGFYEPDRPLTCVGDEADFRKFISGYGVRKGFFTKEYRSVYIPRSISFAEQEFTNIEAAILEFKNRFGVVTYNDTITDWLDVDDRKLFKFPDFYFDEYAQINWKFRVRVDKDLNCKTEAVRTNEAYSADILLEQEAPFNQNIGRDTIYCLGAEMAIQIPKMEFEFDVDFSQSFSDSVGWEFYLFNKNPRASIINPYVKILNDEFYSDIRIIALNNGEVYYPDINGNIQLPSFDQDSMKYTITGVLSSCNAQQLSIELGWDCSELSSKDEPPCVVRSAMLIGEIPPPASEIDLSIPIENLALCDTSEFITFKIINAGLGLMVQPKLETFLPIGMVIVEGSGQRFDQSTGSFVPVDWTLDNQTIKWDLTINGGLQLSGVESEPNNEIEFRFKVITDCDFISGSVIAVEFSGEHVCGSTTNIVRRISPPLKIKDVDLGSAIPLDGAAVVDACSNTIELTLTVNKLFASIDNEIYVQFPFEFTVVEDDGDLIGNVQGQDLVYILPEEPYSKVWKLTIMPLTSLECGNNSIVLNATANAKANCLSSNEECDIKTAVSSFLVDFEIEKPRIEASPMRLFNTEIGEYEVRTTISTQNFISGLTTQYKVIIDVDQDGGFSMGDEILKEGSYIAEMADQELIISGIMVEQEDLCNVLLVIDSEDNCLCQSAIAFYNGGVVETYPYFACVGDTLFIGLENKEGVQYNWEGDALIECDTCSFNDIAVIFDQERVFELSIMSGSGCEATFTYNIIPSPAPTLSFNEEVVCSGDTLFVENLYDEINWIGDGIIANEDQLIALPTENSIYVASLVDDNGCANIDTLYVTLEETPIITAIDTSVCYGNSIVLTVVGAEELEYSWLDEFNQLNDPTIQNPSLTGNVAYNFIVEGSNGVCATTDTLSVDFYDGLDIPSVTDSLFACQNDVVLFELPSNISYEWAPSFNVECLTSDCAMVEITTEMVDRVFIIIGTNEEGCKDTIPLTIEVSVNDVFNEDLIQFCKGESIEYNGLQISTEQQLCDTSGVNCKIINCTTFTFYSDIDSVFYEAEIERGSSIELEIDETFDVYEWEDDPTLSCTGCPNPTANPVINTTYLLNTENDSGCGVVVRYDVSVVDVCIDPPPFIPNAFTPNNNGENDIFNVSNYSQNGVEVKSIKVYNEWGMKIFESKDNTGWDGRYNEEVSPPGQYAYIIEIGCDEDTILYKGGVTLIR